MSKNAVERYTSRTVGGKSRDFLVRVTGNFESSYNKSPLKFGELSDGRQVALKFPRTGLAINEYTGLELLHHNGVRVPEPIALVEREEEPTSGILVERLKGRTLEEVASSQSRFLQGEKLGKCI